MIGVCGHLGLVARLLVTKERKLERACAIIRPPAMVVKNARARIQTKNLVQEEAVLLVSLILIMCVVVQRAIASVFIPLIFKFCFQITFIKLR